MKLYLQYLYINNILVSVLQNLYIILLTYHLIFNFNFLIIKPHKKQDGPSIVYSRKIRTKPQTFR